LATQTLPQPERRKGFTPFPNDVLLDWPRLLSGNAQVFTVMYINSETTGAARARGTSPPYWSRPIATEELAGFARCGVRTIQLALDELISRKVIERKASLHGACRYHIPFETWAGLPDRPTNVVPISGDPEELEAESPDATPDMGQVIAVFSKPQRLRSGLRPRPKELPVAAGKLRVTSDADVEYTGTICAGVLHLDFKIPKDGRTKGEAQRSISENGSSKYQKTQHGIVDDRHFSEFERTARRVGMSFSKTDLVAMYKEWLKIQTREDQLAAIKGLLDRHEAGEFSDPTFIPLPQNYLRKRTWERAIRKPSGEKGDDKFLRNMAAARRLGREMDRKAGRL
jgi:hypothetical protein